MALSVQKCNNSQIVLHIEFVIKYVGESLSVQRRVRCAKGAQCLRIFEWCICQDWAGYLHNIDIIYYGVNSIILYKLGYYSIQGLFIFTWTSIFPVSQIFCWSIWVVSRSLAVSCVVRIQTDVTFSRLSKTFDALKKRYVDHAHTRQSTLEKKPGRN